MKFKGMPYGELQVHDVGYIPPPLDVASYEIGRAGIVYGINDAPDLQGLIQKGPVITLILRSKRGVHDHRVEMPAKIPDIAANPFYVHVEMIRVLLCYA